MEEFTLKRKNQSVEFTYANDTLTVNVTYNRDGVSGQLRDIHGDVYRTATATKGNGERVGWFTGTTRQDGGNAVKYSLSEMTHADSDAVWDVIEAVEPRIIDGSVEHDGGQEAE